MLLLKVFATICSLFVADSTLNVAPSPIFCGRPMCLWPTIRRVSRVPPFFSVHGHRRRLFPNPHALPHTYTLFYLEQFIGLFPEIRLAVIRYVNFDVPFESRTRLDLPSAEFIIIIMTNVHAMHATHSFVTEVTQKLYQRISILNVLSIRISNDNLVRLARRRNAMRVNNAICVRHEQIRLRIIFEMSPRVPWMICELRITRTGEISIVNRPPPRVRVAGPRTWYTSPFAYD